MKKPTLAALLTGLVLVDYVQAIIPSHVIRNYLAAKVTMREADDSPTVIVGADPSTVSTDSGTDSSSIAFPSVSDTTSFIESVAPTDQPCGLTLSDGSPASGCTLASNSASSPGASGGVSGTTEVTSSTDSESQTPAASGTSPVQPTASGSGSTDPTALDSTAGSLSGLPSPTEFTARVGSPTADSGLSSIPLTSFSEVSGSVEPTATSTNSAETTAPTIIASSDNTVPIADSTTGSSDPAVSTLSSDFPSRSSPPPEQTTESGSSVLPPAGSSSTSLAFVSSTLVISGSITVPPQTATETGAFETITLTDHTGPPGSISATTTTDSDHRPTVFPVWFNKGGFPVIVIPVGNNGPPGIIPPPPGFPPVIFDPAGNPVPAPTPDPTPNPDPSPSLTSNPTPDPTADPIADPTSDPSSASMSSISSTSSASITPSDTTDGTSQISSTDSSSSTSTAATEVPTPLLIFPKDSASQSDKAQFQSELAKQVGGESNIDTEMDVVTGVVFWTAPLNSTQVAELQSNPVIDSIFPDAKFALEGFEDIPIDDDDNNNDDDGVPSPVKLVRRAVTSQVNAPRDLAVVSQPQGQTPPRIPRDYQFDDSAGSGITIFVIDTGANAAHVEFTGLSGTKKFLFSGSDRDEDDKQGHGSCVLSMAVSPTFGVAKNSNIVVVKMGFLDEDGILDFKYSDFIKALDAVINEVSANNNALKGKAVVNISFGLLQLTDDQQRKALERIRRLNNQDIPIIAASGNKGNKGVPEVDSWPALFENDLPGSIIVVGATRNNGVVAPFSQGGPLVTVFAPATNIQCMPKSGTAGTRTGAGTSFAAPKVAGLAAYLMGLPNANFQAGQVPAQVKAQVNALAFPRVAGGLAKVLSNGINPPCGSGSGSANKRDDRDTCSLPQSASSASELPVSSSASTESSSAPTSMSVVVTFSTVTGTPLPPDSSTVVEQSSATLITDFSTPPTSSTVTSAPPLETINPNDPNCVTCSVNVGKSDCRPKDGNCLLQQCRNDVSCKLCNIDCNSFL